MNSSIAQQLLQATRYATIATADKSGKPWNTPVFCAYDEHGCIYWSSHPDSVHSQNIAANPQVCIVIFNSNAAEGEGLGLYIDATVEMVSDGEQIAAALTLLGNRRGKPFEHPEKFVGSGPQRIYKATPQKMWTNDADQDADGDFIRDYREEI